MISQIGRIAIFSGLLLGILPLRAQSPQINPAEMIRVRSIEAETIASPKYAADVRGESLTRDGRLEWLMVKVIYDTAPKWTDEITFTFYVVLKGKAEDLPRGAKELNMFSETVTIVNVPETRNGETTVFLDPYTLARYGEATHVAVEVSINGQPAGKFANPSLPQNAPGGWWERETPNQTPLLTRDKTPYALIEIDKQNTIKP
ncbi:hypothetical protein P0Y35_12855 [Kiritimatiellaeota bacterium B1221]|nr:hypothetical protein [Kiritimatiellaeota bacterium B1221]